MTSGSGTTGGYRSFLIPAIALAVLVGLYLAKERLAVESTPDPSPPAKAPTTPPVGASSAERPASPIESTAAPAEPERPALHRAGRDRAKRDAMLLELRDALAARSSATATPDAKADAKEEDAKEPGPLPTLDKDYIQARIREDLLPLATECYESALEQDEAIAGRMVMKFAIVGDEEIGGLVDNVELAEDNEIKHEGLVECMRESMLSVTFDPPQGGGQVQVTYPFVFSTDPDGG
ncbi:MAG: AgmX/PglI C-terminal domain-containing protein [Myxococcales bacterium]|nr:AgmX/PglI C-terminal domain-containing protein [Myxococcales bacterium]